MLKAIFKLDMKELLRKKTHCQSLNKPQKETLEIIMNFQTSNGTEGAFCFPVPGADTNR